MTSTTRLSIVALLPLTLSFATPILANELYTSPTSNIDNRIIVKYHPAVTPVSLSSAMVMTSSLAQSTGGEFEFVRDMSDGAHVLDISDELDNQGVEEICAKLAEDPRVAYAVPDMMVHITEIPDDTRYTEQWHYSESNTGIKLPEAWGMTTGDKDIVVAVLDTGILPHKDLQGQVLKGYDFVSHKKIANDGDGRDSDPSDPGDWLVASECGLFIPPKDRNSSWHGTHVAGTIAAKSNNGLGVAGIAWGSKILPIRALGKCGGFLSDIADGMRWAAGMPVKGVPTNQYPANVINMSLGGLGYCNQVYQDAIDDVTNLGVTVVVAAGNDKTDVNFFAPANCDNVITVTATNRKGERAHYANFGSAADLAAPGGVGHSKDAVLSTSNTGTQAPKDDTYAFYQGTSMATPHVTGVVALMLAVNEELRPADIETLLKKTTQAFPKSTNATLACTKGLCGTGILDAGAAVKAAQSYKTASGAVMQLRPAQARDELFGLQGSEAHFVFEVPKGASDLSVELTGGLGDADLFMRLGAKVTTQSFDWSSEKLGNEERIIIAKPEAGQYYLAIRGQGDYIGATLMMNFDNQGDTLTLQNQKAVIIPDGDAEGVISVIEVSKSMPATHVEVSVDITHPYRGELKVELITPKGNIIQLYHEADDVEANLIKTFRLGNVAETSQGEWQLRVIDTSTFDEGQLNHWSIAFK